MLRRHGPSIKPEAGRESMVGKICKKGRDVVSVLRRSRDVVSKRLGLVSYPLSKAASFDTFRLVAPQPQEIETDVPLHLTRTQHGLFNELSTEVLRCP